MAVAAAVKFYCFENDLALGVHNLDTDDIVLYLSNSAPDVANDTVKADVPEIATGNGYAGPISLNNSFSSSVGIGSLDVDPTTTITAAGGSIGPFRYVIMCNNTKLGKPLMQYWDYGAPITINDGATFQANFNDPPGVASTIQ